jgi:hypothetical protein
VPGANAGAGRRRVGGGSAIVTLVARDLVRLSALLDEAMALDSAQRDAWLAALPPEDKPYAEALRQAFDEEQGSTSFLEDMPRLGPRHDAVAQPGDSVGPYRLLRELGHGGMGSVWVAERRDGALRRQVALKLPRLAWGAGLAERMARERDIAARLEHPHIARLYDAGVDERGRPYLAFELIDGQRIDVWCTQARLGTRARLKLFLQVAQAVAYAHARLVVHRDLKPSNVLVSADAQVHLLDFGIAKLLRESQGDDTGLTQVLGQALTPGYASPEQLRGEPVTVASDVYSLGVLLYELLTGHSPHPPTHAGVAALEQAVLQAEPPAASRRVDDRQRAHSLRGDVDAILAKALRHDPAQRYATVDAFADDVTRTLEGEPVLARPATPLYRLRKFVARHTPACVAGVAVAAAAIVAAVVTVVQQQRATAEARQAEIVKAFVIEAFRASVQDDPDDAGQSPSFERLLERNSQLIDRAGSPRLQAQLYGIVADLLLDAKSFDLAARNARKEIAVLDQAAASPAELAAPALLLSKALLGSDALQAAEDEANRSLALAQAGNDAMLACQARMQLSQTLAAAGRFDAAAAELDQVDAELPPADPATRAQRARSLALRAGLHDARDDEAGAEDLLRKAIDTATSTDGPPSRLAIDLQLELARHLVLRGQDDAARAMLVPALAVSRASGGTDAALIQAEMGALALYAGLRPKDVGRTLSEIERSHAAIVAQGPHTPALQRAWADIYAAEGELQSGDYVRAHDLARRAAPVLLPVTREARSRVLLLDALARSDVLTGATVQAQPLLVEWLALASQRFPNEAWKPRLAMAHSLLDTGRWAEADALLAGLGPGPTPSAQSAIADARIRSALEQGQFASARALADDPRTTASAAMRAEAECAGGQAADGLALLDLQTAVDTDGRYLYSPKSGREQAVRGLCELALGHRPDAIELERAAGLTFAGQPGAGAAFRRPLERLRAALHVAQAVPDPHRPANAVRTSGF